jgi:hypothetical protein
MTPAQEIQKQKDWIVASGAPASLSKVKNSGVCPQWTTMRLDPDPRTTQDNRQRKAEVQGKEGVRDHQNYASQGMFCSKQGTARRQLWKMSPKKP